MLDLVESQTKRIEATFLEPSCGDGAFLSEILKRKLGIVKNIYQKVNMTMSAIQFLPYLLYMELNYSPTMYKTVEKDCSLFGIASI